MKGGRVIDAQRGPSIAPLGEPRVQDGEPPPINKLRSLLRGAVEDSEPADRAVTARTRTARGVRGLRRNHVYAHESPLVTGLGLRDTHLDVTDVTAVTDVTDVTVYMARTRM